jgi:hypothetical protein
MDQNALSFHSAAINCINEGARVNQLIHLNLLSTGLGSFAQSFIYVGAYYVAANYT